MSENVKRITIQEVMRKGWLQAIFEPLCKEIMEREDKPQTPKAVLEMVGKADGGKFFEEHLSGLIALEDQMQGRETNLSATAQSKKVHDTLSRIFTDGRYPPTSPDDIVGIIDDGNYYDSECIANATGSIAIRLKAMIPKHLKALTGEDYKIW